MAYWTDASGASEVFFAYNSTMQNTCIRLMGKKMLGCHDAGRQILGRRLAVDDDDEDMLSAMARELVEKAGVGETADAIWRDSTANALNSCRHRLQR